jgi:hypothetical protein
MEPTNIVAVIIKKDNFVERHSTNCIIKIVWRILNNMITLNLQSVSSGITALSNNKEVLIID